MCPVPARRHNFHMFRKPSACCHDPLSERGGAGPDTNNDFVPRITRATACRAHLSNLLNCFWWFSGKGRLSDLLCLPSSKGGTSDSKPGRPAIQAGLGINYFEWGFDMKWVIVCLSWSIFRWLIFSSVDHEIMTRDQPLKVTFFWLGWTIFSRSYGPAVMLSLIHESLLGGRHSGCCYNHRQLL